MHPLVHAGTATNVFLQHYSVLPAIRLAVETIDSTWAVDAICGTLLLRVASTI